VKNRPTEEIEMGQDYGTPKDTRIPQQAKPARPFGRQLSEPDRIQITRCSNCGATKAASSKCTNCGR
jgi:hypothetical protein